AARPSAGPPPARRAVARVGRRRRAAAARGAGVVERTGVARDRRRDRGARARLDRQVPARPLLTGDPFGRLSALGFAEKDARTLADHFLDAERRGKRGHGMTRVEWLETLDDLNPRAEPECVVAEACYERWEGRGALGYLTLAAICDGQLEDPPEAARLIAAHDTFPTGMLGYWARRLAAGGLLAVLTAASPATLRHPA